MPDHERQLHDAYLAEVGHWRAHTPLQRVLAFMEHARYRLVAGGPSLVQVAVGSLLLAAGSAVMAIDRTPNNPRYRPPTSNALQVGISIGMILLAATLYIRPRILAAARYACGACPIAGCFLYSALVFRSRVIVPDLCIRVGMFIAFAGSLTVWWATWRNRPEVLRRSLQVLSLAAVLGAAGNLWWTILFSRSGDDVIAMGTLLVTGGCLLLGRGLWRARPEVSSITSE